MTQELLAKQPKPDGVGAGTEIASYLLGYLAHENTSSGFLEAISHRMLTGEVKFGIRLQSGNGRDPYADAFQQSLDTVLSLGQALVEGTGDKGITTMLLTTAIQLSEGILMAANVRRGLEAPEAPVEEEPEVEEGSALLQAVQSLTPAQQEELLRAWPGPGDVVESPSEPSLIGVAKALGHTPASIQIPDPIVVLDEPIPMPPDPSELSKDATTEMLVEPK